MRRDWPEAARVEIARLEAKLAEVRRALRSSEGKRARLEQRLARVKAELQQAKATIREFRHQLFGRHNEQGALAGAEPEDSTEPAAAAQAEAAAKPEPAAQPEPEPAAGRPAPRKRGGQRGHAGHSRRIEQRLHCTERVQTLPEEQRHCAHCGAVYAPMPGAFAVSVLLDWAVTVFYVRVLRQKYRRTCSCTGTPTILTAPPPPKVVPKGLLSAQFIARVCVEKFWLGRPLHRILRGLALDVPALPVSSGGVVRTLKRLAVQLQPLHAAICERVRHAPRVDGDETTATVLAPQDEPAREADHRPRWWTWCFCSRDAVAFVVRQHRDTQVPFTFFGWDPEHPPLRPFLILLTDCYIVYKDLAGWVINAYCWAHLRRRFIKAARTLNSAPVARWAEAWRRRIADLYLLNEARRTADPAHWPAADQRLRAHVAAMRAAAQEQLTIPDLHKEQRKVLNSLLKHWAGLTLFLDHPDVPLDNNAIERILRGPVVGRKNFLFFGNIWSAELAGMLWSILATAQRNGLNPLTYLTALLQAIAENGGQPLDGAALARFLPWAVSDEDRAVWSAPLPSVLLQSFADRTPPPQRRPRRCRRQAPAAPAPAAADSS